jgi:hypothetical protein
MKGLASRRSLRAGRNKSASAQMILTMSSGFRDEGKRLRSGRLGLFV